MVSSQLSSEDVTVVTKHTTISTICYDFTIYTNLCDSKQIDMFLHFNFLLTSENIY